MEIITNLSDYQQKQPLALTLGMFDGVHLGHQSIINQLKKASEDFQLKPAVLSFWPHPRKILNPDFQVKLLTTLEEKKCLLEKLGIEFLFLQEFHEEFKNVSADDFIKNILVEQLHTKYIVIGHDHVFGKERKGNFQMLKDLSKDLDFQTEQIHAFQKKGIEISSTKIRKALSDGNVKEANAMLGYSYFFSGEVVKGNQLGRTIGFPTANIKVDEMKLMPKNASYIVKVHHENNTYKGMMNIGLRPTVDGKKLQTEVFILDFAEDIYGKTITIELIDFLRDETKFNGVEELKNQLEKDKIFVENYSLFSK